MVESSRINVPKCGRGSGETCGIEGEKKKTAGKKKRSNRPMARFGPAGSQCGLAVRPAYAGCEAGQVTVGSGRSAGLGRPKAGQGPVRSGTEAGFSRFCDRGVRRRGSAARLRRTPATAATGVRRLAGVCWCACRGSLQLMQDA